MTLHSHSRSDLRLLLPALVAWVTVAVVLVVIPSPMRENLAIPALVGLAASASAGAWVMRTHARPSSIAAVVVLASMSVAALAATIHASALAQEPLASWAKARCDVVIEGVVTTEPQTFAARQAAVWQDSQIIQAGLATTRVICTKKAIDVQVPLLVRVHKRAQLPPPGSIVLAQGRLLTSASSSSAALLIAHQSGSNHESPLSTSTREDVIDERARRSAPPVPRGMVSTE